MYSVIIIFIYYEVSHQNPTQCEWWIALYNPPVKESLLGRTPHDRGTYISNSINTNDHYQLTDSSQGGEKGGVSFDQIREQKL